MTAANLNTNPCYLYDNANKRKFVNFPKGLEGPAEFPEEEAIFKEAMEKSGITIPIEMKSQYSELKARRVSAIFLDDSSFGKAFYNIRYKLMNQDNYKWRIIIKDSEINL